MFKAGARTPSAIVIGFLSSKAANLVPNSNFFLVRNNLMSGLGEFLAFPILVLVFELVLVGFGSGILCSCLGLSVSCVLSGFSGPLTLSWFGSPITVGRVSGSGFGLFTKVGGFRLIFNWFGGRGGTSSGWFLVKNDCCWFCWLIWLLYTIIFSLIDGLLPLASNGFGLLSFIAGSGGWWVGLAGFLSLTK